MAFKRFTKPKFLRKIGRELLGELFDRFKDDLFSSKVALPDASLEDDDFFQQLSHLLLSPAGLPDNLVETLCALEDMANEEGQERLERAVQRRKLDLKFREKSSRADIAVQVFLADSQLLFEAHTEQKLSRLVRFDYFGSRNPVDRSGSFVPPDSAALDSLAAELDPWFKEHNRGEGMVHIEVHPMGGEFWFIVHHGDTYARKLKKDKRKIETVRFYPAKDDLVVYSPQRDEIGVCAGTLGEMTQYRQAFGRLLSGEKDYFSERLVYTLEPLRAQGEDALNVDGVQGLSRVRLRKYKAVFEPHGESVVRKADDIFAAARSNSFVPMAVPAGGRLIWAEFDFDFGDSHKPRKVRVQPPNTLSVERHGDAPAVHQWLSARNFCVAESAE